MLEPQSHGGKGSNRRVHTSPYSGTWTLDASVSRTTSIVLSGVSMPTTARCILAMSTVLSTYAVGLYLVYVTVFRYIFPLRESARGIESVRIREQRP